MLPITLQMQIDLSAAAHKREIAEGFAKLRGELLPERKPTQQELYLQAMMERMRPAPDPLHRQQMHAGYWNPYLNPLQSANAAWNNYGLASGRSTGGGWLGLGTPWF